MQGIIDPEELVAFANSLEAYVQALEEETNKISGAFEHVKETWNDQKTKEFEEKFNELRGTMAGFENNAREQIPALRAMAEHADNYLKV
ncbi:MAG: WXG100 family type VII secretion target [Lachnospiraceae bacterium]|nr:WXG100 family type VII secretion target [Lachnospiraceae bacterium]